MITAAELRARQAKYLQEVDDEQLQRIAERLEKAWKTTNTAICVETLNVNNRKKLEAAGYKVKFEPGDYRDPSYYYISW